MEVFDEILDEGERVLEVFKPKLGAFISRSVLVTFFAFLVFLFMAIPVFGSETVAVSVALAILFAVCVLFMAFEMRCYKNTFYAVTDRRIIIRTGHIGVDYRTLDIKAITSSEVNVSLVNKIFGGGTVTFGSASAPILGTTDGRAQSRPFAFRDIPDPYENYNKIKQLMRSAAGDERL